MTRTDAYEALLAAFSSVDEDAARSLLWHVEHKTPVCCGELSWSLYRDGQGGG